MTVGVFSVRFGKKVVSDRDLMQMLETAQQRQDSKCCCCGLGIPAAVGVIYKDSDQENISPDNILAACKVCEALHNAGRLNATATCGSLIYLPNLSQVEVIQLAHAIKGLQRTMNQAVIAIAAGIRGEEIAMLKKPVKAYLGFSETDQLADFFRAMSPKAYQHRIKGLGPIRWWPNMESDQLTPFLTHYRDSLATEELLKAMK